MSNVNNLNKISILFKDVQRLISMIDEGYFENLSYEFTGDDLTVKTSYPYNTCDHAKITIENIRFFRPESYGDTTPIEVFVETNNDYLYPLKLGWGSSSYYVFNEDGDCNMARRAFI